MPLISYKFAAGFDKQSTSYGAENKWIDGNSVMMESLRSMVRAGADSILTYAAIEVAENLTS